MTKMVGFIKFGKGCIKADSVVAIERYATYSSVDSVLSGTRNKVVKVYLNTGVALAEQFETDAEAEDRYSKVCELVSEGVSSAIPLKCDVD